MRVDLLHFPMQLAAEAAVYVGEHGHRVPYVFRIRAEHDHGFGIDAGENVRPGLGTAPLGQVAPVLKVEDIALDQETAVP